MPDRCSWANSDPLYVTYHDEEWGVPVHDDRTFFEFINLEGAQAGLSWLTILRKREGYREAFANWDVEKVAQFTEEDQARLLENPGIIRNRAKIKATIGNAKAFIEIQKEFGSFDKYIWGFVGGTTIKNRESDVPAKTPESDAMSKDLLKRGFKFVGSTICYAFMQATGLVDDHAATCFRHQDS